jgi:ubiquitin-conjugating enzyme E2 Z
MSNLFTRRLIYEIKIYESQKHFLNKSGIYLDYNSDDMTTKKLLIIGPDNTPYQGGFYFFNITIPINYPFSPPKFTFLNKCDGIRYHPNFYVDGYVCLSILNTWGQNEWSPCQTITAIASTIQSVMNDNPIINEPGYETETGVFAQDYYKIIEYYNIFGAVLKEIRFLQLDFANFKPIIINHFLSNYDKYLKIIKKNKQINNEVVTCQIYSLSVKLEYDNLEINMDRLKTNLL